MTIVYNVTFRPGRYKYAPSAMSATGIKSWVIGREDDGFIVGFAFEEDAAKQIVFALNLADAYICGDSKSRLELTRALEGLSTQH